MIFLCLPKCTAVMSSINAKRLACVMGKRCVFYEVGGGVYKCCLREFNASFRQLVACLSSRRTGFDPRSVHVRLVVDRMALGQVFLRILRFFPCLYHSISAAYSSSFTRCSYQDKESKSGNLPKKHCFFGSRGLLDRKVLPLPLLTLHLFIKVWDCALSSPFK